MDEDRTCPQCGQQLPADARTHGLCPWCLLRSALGGPPATGEPDTFVPPNPAELADEFPDLDILELLHHGGMAAVYKARQRSLDRLTAVKVFPREVTGDPASAERFRHEARTLAKLNHPHIVAAYEFGQSPSYCYFVMEFVKGITLRRALAAKPLSAARALTVACQICDALAFAHGCGVVHRDIKPENILFDADNAARTGSGRIRVADFGLAKVLHRQAADLTLTGPGQRLGTVHYMAPEQLDRPDQVDQRADIYAVGVVLYEMLTGELPIGRFPEPSKLADVGAEVDALVLRCLEKSPGDRFPTAEALREALAEQLPSASPTAPHRRGRRVRRRRRWTSALAAAGLLVLGAAVAGPIAWRKLIRPRPGEPRGPAAGRSANAPGTSAARTPRGAIPAEFFMPFEHLRSDELKGFRRGRAKWLARAGATFGPHRIAGVWVYNLPADRVPFVLERLEVAGGAESRDAISAVNSVHVTLAPVDNLAAMAAKIDFGEVIAIDAERRVIAIEADAAKLPPPLKPEVTNPRSPQFYRRNLEDLGCWDGFRRFAALKRLRLAEPRQLRREIAAAMEAFLREPHPLPRRLAAEALGTWGADENVPALAALVADKDSGVRRAAMSALARLGTQSGARAVATRMAADPNHAGACLRQMGAAAEPAVLDLLEAPDRRVRLEAVAILGEIGTAQSVPALEAVAAGEDARLARAAREALRALRRR